MRQTKSMCLTLLVFAAGILMVLVSGNVHAAITSPLTHYSANPHYFANNGQPVVFLGAGQILAANKTVNYRADIDEMAAHKVNYARIWAFNTWCANEEYFPFARDGGGTANDGLAKYNLTHWDSNYWSQIKDACSYCQSKGIYVDIIVFDRCGMDTPTSSSDHRWDWNPYNPENNVNGLSLPTSPDGIPEFYNLSNSGLLSIQENYVSKLISETSQYANVTYEICNEYTGGTWTWEQHWVDFIKARCSNMVSINHLGSPSNTPSTAWTYSGVDLIKFHVTDTSASTSNSYVTANYSKNQAMDIDETPEVSGISFTNYRNMLWGAFVGGGHIHLENGSNVGDSLTAVNYIWNFIQTNNVQYWTMSPNNSLVTSSPGGTAYVLAKPGYEYVVYVKGSGQGSMTISLASGTSYTAKAYNPSNDTYTNLTVSGNTISGIPSYSSDIVIYIKASGTITGSPNVTLSLSADKTSATPGTTITYTITYKNAGTSTAQNVSINSPISANTTYVSGSGGTYDSSTQTVKWTISSVPAGSTGTVSYKITVK